MIKSVGLIANTRKKQPVQLGRELIDWFKQKGIAVYTTPEDGLALEVGEEMISSRLGEVVDCVLTLGGDGTLLRAARLTSPHVVPILGINLGVLGFLTEVEIPELYDSLERFIQGEYYFDDRMMLEVSLKRGGRITHTFVGLNDIFVKGPLARLVIVDVFVNDQYVTTYNGDGVIISSPTGSTAYSLSAGGPIVHPEVEVILITPICPHTLHARPLIIAAQKTVRIGVIKAPADSMMTIDGQQGLPVESGDEIIAARAPQYTRLVRIKPNNFFDILQEKLKTEGRISYD
ncbi:MAG: NAD(+)/NADH kinase [Clostridia bacterium]|jgi:NAD+ kinase|nr:NAD(+)/NADH kinase [Clostridia bacterium]